MNKTIKGAGAAVAAGVLLFGGAGSLAFWSASESVAGGSISSGELKLTETSCDATWSLNGGTYTDPVADDPGTTEVDETDAGTLIVPGDTLTKSCSYTIEAAGENLSADLTVTAPAESGAAGLTEEVDTSGAFTVNGATATTITEENDGQPLVATITVDFPFGVEDNGSQDLTAALDAYTVTATQTNATP